MHQIQFFPDSNPYISVEMSAASRTKILSIDSLSFLNTDGSLIHTYAREDSKFAETFLISLGEFRIPNVQFFVRLEGKDTGWSVLDIQIIFYLPFAWKSHPWDFDSGVNVNYSGICFNWNNNNIILLLFTYLLYLPHSSLSKAQTGPTFHTLRATLSNTSNWGIGNKHSTFHPVWPDVGIFPIVDQVLLEKWLFWKWSQKQKYLVYLCNKICSQ